MQHPSLQISRYNTSHTVSKIHVLTHPTKASQTAELKLPKFQTSSTPPQVKHPRTTNHLYVLTTQKPTRKESTKLTRPQKLKIQAIKPTTPKYARIANTNAKPIRPVVEISKQHL